MTDIIKAVRQFTEAVGCTTDRYNVRQTALYIGLQLEEMKEKLESLGFNNVRHSGGFYTDLMAALHKASREFKEGDMDVAVEEADRAALLDADIDLAWVTLGSAFSQGADVEGAAGEVARAKLLSRARECAEWHVGDGDECGTHARAVMADIDALLGSNAEVTGAAPHRKD